MSELKARHIVDVYDDYAINPFGERSQVYLKSEADKVLADKDKEIAELENRIDDGDKDFEMAAHQNERLLKIVRHQKYKRCLANAKECEATALWCYQAANTLPTGFKATLFGKPVMIEPLRLYNRFGRLMKWNNRWLKIAEQFKDKEADK